MDADKTQPIRFADLGLRFDPKTRTYHYTEKSRETSKSA